MVPAAQHVTVVHGNDSAMMSLGNKILKEAINAGLCVSAVFEADFFSKNDSELVDKILMEANKGNAKINAIIIAFRFTCSIALLC